LTVINKDLSLLASLVVAYIASNTQDLSEESIASLKDIAHQSDLENIKNSNASDDEVVNAVAEAFYNLKEITEAYNDLEYEGE